MNMNKLVLTLLAIMTILPVVGQSEYISNSRDMDSDCIENLETFTEEGLPKDPNADLSKVKGLGDLDKAEPLSKEATELRAELDKSIASANSLESLNLSSILKK